MKFIVQSMVKYRFYRLAPRAILRWVKIMDHIEGGREC